MAMRLRRRSGRDAELMREIEAHHAHEVDAWVARGMDAAEAERQARIKSGSARRVREEVWQMNSNAWLENLLRDLRYAVRTLAKSPGYAAIAVLTLALGIGANTAVFSLMNALLLRPLAVPHSERLALIRMQTRDEGGYIVSAPLFRALETRHEVFSDVFAYAPRGMQVRDASGTVVVDGQFVSGQYFSALQVPAELGRTLTAADDQPGGGAGGPAVVISHGYWKSQFNGAKDVIGRRLMVNNVMFTVAGVMPASFRGARVAENPKLYVPLEMERELDAPFSNIKSGIHAIWLTMGARLQPGVTLEQAAVQMKAASRGIIDSLYSEADWPEGFRKRTDVFLQVEPGSKGYLYLRDRFRKPLLMVSALCGIVLLVACMNLASLMLARAASREREIATRYALGANRRRLVAQLLTESLLLAVMGTLAGLLLALPASKGLASFISGSNDSVQFDVSLDGRVFVFVTGIAVMATLLVGVAPALQSTRGELQERIRDGSLAVRGGERLRLWPRVLLGAEVALALMLVTGAGLLGRSVLQLYRIGPGFDPHHVAVLSLDVSKQSREGAALTQFYREYAEALAAVPGVESVGMADVTPISGSIFTIGGMHPVGAPDIDLHASRVGPGYIHAMRIPLLEGRDLRWTDEDEKAPKVLLGATAAKKLFPGRSAAGQELLREEGESHRTVRYEVAGVVGDTKYEGLREDAPAEIYFSVPSELKGDFKKLDLNLMVRLKAGANAEQFAQSVQAITRRMAPDIPLPDLLTMDQQIDESIASERMMAMLSLCFGAAALLVTAIGLYGTLAYRTARRTSEIGIRMALGAQRGQVIGLIFRENAWIALSGCLAGLGASMIATKWIASFLYGTPARDPLVFGVALFLLAAIAAVASLIPAVRAARIDPMLAIRCE